MQPHGFRFEPVLGRRARRAASLLGIWAMAACGDGIGRPLIAASGGAAGVSGWSGTAGLSGVAGGESAEGGKPAGLGGLGGSQGGLAGDGFDGKGARPPGWFQGDERGGTNGGLGRMGFNPSGDAEGVVPDTELCDPVREWPFAAASAEKYFVEFINYPRVTGAQCGADEFSDPDGEPREGDVPVLVRVPALNCAARLHSLDRATRDFLGSVNPDGEGPAERLEKVGVSSAEVREVVFSSDPSRRDGVDTLVQGIIRKGGADCEALLDPRFDAIGVGYYEGHWTVDLAASQP